VVRGAIRASALCALGLAVLGCESILGIHDRQQGPTGTAGTGGQPIGAGGTGGRGGNGGSIAGGGSGGSGGSNVGVGGGGSGGSNVGVGGGGSGGSIIGGSAGAGGAGIGGTGVAGSGGGGGMGGSGGSASGGRGGTGPGGGGGMAGAGVGGVGGRGGAIGTAGRGGTTGAAGRGGTTGSGGSGSILFMDDFETGMDGWEFAGDSTATHMVVVDGSGHALQMNSTASDQHIGAAGSVTWTDQVVEARLKVIAFSGTSSSDLAAICGRLSDAEHFYYFGIQSNGVARIKVNNNGNSSLGGTISIPNGFQLNTGYLMRLSIVGTTLTAYIDNTMVGQVTDSALTNGAVGLMVQNTNAMFDDVVVRAP
jgi:hypothetical protein